MEHRDKHHKHQYMHQKENRKLAYKVEIIEEKAQVRVKQKQKNSRGG